jgi:hypothetical protein
MPEWTVDVKGEPLANLLDSLSQGPISDSGKRLLTEKQVARVGPLKIEIFSDEHPPPHFRVSYQGQSANYTISDCTPINGGLGRFYKNIREWHAEYKQTLIEVWNRTRPTDCPVGEYREQQ